MERISTSHQYGSYSRNIASAQQRYLKVQNQIGTGKRLLKPSDDPAGTASLVGFGSLKASFERYKENLEIGKSQLGFAESALGEANDLVRRAYQLAVQGANGATDQAARVGMVREIEEIQRRLVDLGNEHGPDNRYLFSGHALDTKPFTVAGSALVYNGDAGVRTIETAPGETMAVSVSASPMFTDAYASLESLKTNLQGGNPGAISGIDLPALQGVMATLTGERGKVGARLQQIGQLDADYQRRIDDFTSGISNIEDVDMAQAITEYHLAETAYTAALNVASQGFRLSLMDFIQT